ncbi:MAG: sigma-70 family RNA polymerase sigma factor [Actinomycetota bacterium]|nr:sigma-70 family RNA polymerase sigma factor [Actinomycetota bacterium]
MPDDLELRRLSRPELAALVVAGLRGGTDAQRARAEAAWALLAALDIDRVRGIVATFRFPEHEHVRIDEQDQRDTVQEAHERLLKMLPNLYASTDREYLAALVTCVRYACMDFCQRQMRREMGIGGSLQETLPDVEGEDEDRGRFDWLVARAAIERRADSEWARDELEAAIEAWAALSNENMRRVISLKAEDTYSSREIAERLGLSAANVDQLRLRGLRKMRGQMEGDD